jgi:hypothetical protein
MSYLLKKQVRIWENNLICLDLVHNQCIYNKIKKWLLLDEEDYFIRNKGDHDYYNYGLKDRYQKVTDLFGNHFQYQVEGVVIMSFGWHTIQLEKSYILFSKYTALKVYTFSIKNLPKSK